MDVGQQVVGSSSAGAPPMSLRAYARHRQTSATSVLRAIRSGRLRQSLVRVHGVPQIADPQLADQEWARHTDYSRAPYDVKERAAFAPGAGGPPLEDLGAPASASAPPLPPVTRLGMSVTEASAAEKYWKSRLAELEFQSKMGELVSSRAVEARVVNLFGLCRTKLLGVPTRARSAMPELTHAQIATLDDLIRLALQDMAAEPVVADSGGAAA